MRRVSGWWWAGGGIALLGLLIVGAICWFYSNADLRRVQAEARAAGLATTADEAGFRDMDAAERAVLERVLSAARRQPSLTEKDFQKAPHWVEPPNDALIAYHGAISAEFWAELDTALGALPEEPTPLFKIHVPTTRLEVITEQRSLVRLLAERIRLCPADELPARVSQAARIVHLVQNQTLIQQLVDISCAAILIPAVAARREDLRDNEKGRLVAAHLRALHDRLWHARIEAWSGASIELFTAYADIGKLSSPTPAAPATVGFWEQAEERVRSAPRPLVHRLNREAGLRHLVTTQMALIAAADPADLMRHSATFPPPEPILPWLAEFSKTSPYPLSIAYGMVNAGLVKALLGLDVVAADLCGDPLPADPFSPTLAPLRPVERDGRLIGWYSVGSNGVDDGGQQTKDHGIPLAESFGKTFADPPTPR